MKTIVYAMSIVFALGLGTAQADTGLKLGWVDLQAAAQKTNNSLQKNLAFSQARPQKFNFA